MKKLLLFLCIILITAPAVSADDTSSAKLASEIDYFISQQNASGYLVWLFSGAKDKYLENDQYSFYQGSPMCDILKQKAASLPAGKFLGVNIHSLSNHPTDIIDNNLSYLSKDCGTSVIRIWGSPDRGGPAAVKKVLDIAKKYNIKVIVAIADYSNSSGEILPGPIRSNPTSWYQTDYKEKYLPYVLSMATALQGHPALFSYELANEPHCSGIPDCVGPYNLWANNVALSIRQIDPSARVSIGQKANENTTLGDSPGPRHFYDSNNTSSIDFTSGHYYNDSEKTLVTQAANQSRELGKPFYVGEAGFITNEIPSGSSLPAKKGPLEEGFRPTRYDCGDTANPEYNPLRPYPGSPCDPLIPRSVPEAPLTSEKKFNTFACGTSLTPSAIERFDAYGQNGYYENLPTTYGYAHTICDPIPENSPTGTTATCYRTEAFDITLDLSKANLGILGNTQDTALTDAQKVNEYLSWYLTGTPQIGDQLPIDPKNPADIGRVVNYSGPLRKLMPYDLTNLMKNTLAKSNAANHLLPFDNEEQVHNYLVGCGQARSITEVTNDIFSALSTAAGAVSNLYAIAADIATLGFTNISIAISSLYAGIDFQNQTFSVDIAISTFSSQITDPAQIDAFTALVVDIAVNTFDAIVKIISAIDSLNSIEFAKIINCATTTNTADQRRLQDYAGLAPSWIYNLNWYTRSINDEIMQKLFQNLPFSSMEDIAGEVTVSVFRDPAADQQTQNIDDPVSRGGKSTAPLQLIIKSAQLAK